MKSLGLCLRCVYGALAWTFTGVLLVAFCLQAYIAFSLFRDGYVKIPDPLVDWVAAQASEDYWVKQEGVYLNFGGIISVANPSIGAAGLQAPFVEVDQLTIDIDSLMLLVGRLELDRIIVNEARILLPAVYSPTGVSEEIAEIRKLDAREVAGVLSIDAGVLSFGTAQGWAQGEFSLPSIGFGAEYDPDAGDQEAFDLESALLGMYELKEQVSRAEQPILVVSLSTEGFGENALEAMLTGGLTPQPDLAVKVENFELGLRAQMAWTQVQSLSAHVRLHGIEWEDRLSVRALDAQKQLAGPFELNDFINELSITAVDVQGPGMRLPVDLVNARVNIENLARIPVDLSLLWDGGHAFADLEIAPLRNKARVVLETIGIGMRQLETVEDLEKTGFADLVWGLDTSHMHVSTAIGFDGAWEQIDIYGDTGPIAYKGVWLDNAWGELTLLPGTLEVADFGIVGPIGDAYGSLDFAWPSLDLSVYISARMLPPAISPWLESWWGALWEPFTFLESDRPDADFYIDTTIGKRRSTSFYGSVEGGRAV